MSFIQNMVILFTDNARTMKVKSYIFRLKTKYIYCLDQCPGTITQRLCTSKKLTKQNRHTFWRIYSASSIWNEASSRIKWNAKVDVYTLISDTSKHLSVISIIRCDESNNTDFFVEHECEFCATCSIMYIKLILLDLANLQFLNIQVLCLVLRSPRLVLLLRFHCPRPETKSTTQITCTSHDFLRQLFYKQSENLFDKIILNEIAMHYWKLNYWITTTKQTAWANQIYQLLYSALSSTCSYRILIS